MREIDRFFREEHRIIIPVTVRDILDEQSRTSWREVLNRCEPKDLSSISSQRWRGLTARVPPLRFLRIELRLVARHFRRRDDFLVERHHGRRGAW